MYHGVVYKELGLVHTHQLQSTAQVLCDSRPAAHEGPRTSCRESQVPKKKISHVAQAFPAGVAGTPDRARGLGGLRWVR